MRMSLGEGVNDTHENLIVGLSASFTWGSGSCSRISYPIAHHIRRSSTRVTPLPYTRVHMLAVPKREGTS